MTPRGSPSRPPGLWQGVAWAMERGGEGGGISRSRLVWRALSATFTQGKALQRWMNVVSELRARGLVTDLPGEYLRAIRPYVQRHVDVSERVGHLIDHVDWMEAAFGPSALERLFEGKPVVLAELSAPRGYEYMRLQLRRAAAQSPEGELLLTLTLQRSSDVQHKSMPVDAAVLAFSRFRVDGTACLAIGGVRGQRQAVLRMSPVEINQALQGWKPAVLMIRVAQELARFWNLRMIGLDPASHRLQSWTYQWNKRHREVVRRIFDSYDVLWEHFEAKPGPAGWMILPLNSDEKLAATALSPEKRARQTRRADYWIRTRKLLWAGFRDKLLRPGLEARLSRVTQALESGAAPLDQWDEEQDFQNSEDMVPSRVLESGPGTLL
jgi:uncharacterized protein VirK/YbjX